MRILLTTFGTRSDVQPYVAFGCALRDRGHDVTLAAPAAFREMTEGVGVGLHPAGSRMLTMLQEVMPELSGPRDALRSTGDAPRGSAR